jgi:hypothetical protein
MLGLNPISYELHEIRFETEVNRHRDHSGKCTSEKDRSVFLAVITPDDYAITLIDTFLREIVGNTKTSLVHIPVRIGKRAEGRFETDSRPVLILVCQSSDIIGNR